MKLYEKAKKNFGFGCMRLPMKGDEVDYEEFNKMIDAFMDAGFNYFDTARGYLSGKSEIALHDCLTSRYPRESYVLVDKLSNHLFKSEKEIRPVFEDQLRVLGVDYLDFYLMHAQSATSFEKYKACRAYETAFDLKKEGKIKYVGLSFHDKAEVLDRILTEYPELDIVQIQFNYADYEDESVEGRKVYEVCRKHGKPVIVMEPVKGGSLINLPAEAQAVFDSLNGGSNASYAIRFAASFEGIEMVLSGMGNMDMMRENVSFMRDFTPLTDKEKSALFSAADALRAKNIIACTGCRYCVSGCPVGIAIPDFFACLNDKEIFNNWQSGYFYSGLVADGARPSECIGCGACEESCPQKLPIRELLVKVSAAFEKKK